MKALAAGSYLLAVVAVTFFSFNASSVAGNNAPIVQIPNPGDISLDPKSLPLLYQWWGPPPAGISASSATIKCCAAFFTPEPAQRQRRGEYEAEEERSHRFARSRPATGPLTDDTAMNEGATALATQSPQPVLKFLPGVQSHDAEIAVGNKYIIVAHDHRLAFFAKDGSALPGKGGFPSNLSATAFFGAFLAPAKQDGSVNQDNINRFLFFPANSPIHCDVTQSPPTFPCVDEFYDTRVLFDADSKRFFVLSAARHQLWAGKGAKGNTANGDYDAEARRYVAFAVSVSEDPRDGFHQYMLVENNPRDWPRMAVNGDILIVAHNGAVDQILIPYVPHSYVAIGFSVKALRTGSKNAPRFRFEESDLGVSTVCPITQFGSPSGKTLLLSVNGAAVKIFAFSLPGTLWTKPAVAQTALTLSYASGMLRAGAIYRNGSVYFTGVKQVDSGPPPRRSVRVVRIPVTVGANSITASTQSPGYLDWFFGRNAVEDGPGDLVSYEQPSMAVNKNGDMLFAYGRTPIQTQNTLFPEARYSVWYAGAAKQRRSRLLQSGSGHPNDADGNPADFYDGLDLTQTVVDPADDTTFWTIQYYGGATSFQTVVGKVTP